MPSNPLHSKTRSGSSGTRRRRQTRAAMKKTTKKGAYASGKKKAMAIRRAPLVETKRKTDDDLRSAGFFAGGGSSAFIVDRTDYNVYETEHTMLDPLTYYLWSQGLSQSQHIGQAVNLKYTNMKIQVRFPQPFVKVTAAGTELSQQIPDQPMNYELVWGWVPAPLQLTGNTTPAANVVTNTQILNHVNHRVTDYFNSRKDKLQFIPKKDVTIRILGRRKVRPDMRFQSTQPPATADGGDKPPVGTIPDYFTEISWKHKNKKLWLEQTGNINGNSDLVAMYPNYSWLPFCTLVNWNFDEINNHTTHGKKLECPSLAWNSITYFSDS